MVNWANATRVIDIKKSSLSSKQEPVYETVPCVNEEYYDDVATKANESEDISAEGNIFKILLTLLCVILWSF